MSVQVQFAPEPPQLSVELTARQLAALDARLGHLVTLHRRRALAWVVQDAADLLDAHIDLRAGRWGWQGTPGRLDEDGRAPSPSLVGWTEAGLTYGLALDLGRPQLRLVDTAGFLSVLTGWRRGLVYLLRPGRRGAVPVVRRRLNLSNFFDRIELNHLGVGTPGDGVVRAHQLGNDGQLSMLRATLSGGGATRPAAPLAGDGDLSPP